MSNCYSLVCDGIWSNLVKPSHIIIEHDRSNQRRSLWDQECRESCDLYTMPAGAPELSSYQRGATEIHKLLPPARVLHPIKDDNKNILDDDSGSEEGSWDGIDADKYAILDKANHFTLEYDPDRGYRGTTLQFCSSGRPHMRAFHASWICLFTCALVQFSQAPLLAEIQDSLSLSKSDIWWTNLWMMMGGIPMRFILGAMCDVYGARTMMTLMLAGSAIPCAVTGLVATNLTRLTIVRTALGAMDVFVPSQYLITCQFVREVAGTAMAITGGLGALGSGVTQLLLGSMIFPWLLEWTNNDRESAWRWSLVFPAGLALVVAAFVHQFSDDCPLGQISEVKRAGLMMQRSAVDSFRSGVYNLNSWILFIQFAASCGVDFTMCNGAAMFFHYEFHQSTAASGAYAFVYGISAIFARGLGGWISDKVYDKFSLRGRLFAQLVCLTLQGLTNVLFARTKILGDSLVIMIVFSIFVQMSMGTCYGIVVSVS